MEFINDKTFQQKNLIYISSFNVRFYVNTDYPFLFYYVYCQPHPGNSKDCQLLRTCTGATTESFILETHIRTRNPSSLPSYSKKKPVYLHFSGFTASFSVLIVLGLKSFLFTAQRPLLVYLNLKHPVQSKLCI